MQPHVHAHTHTHTHTWCHKCSVSLGKPWHWSDEPQIGTGSAQSMESCLPGIHPDSRTPDSLHPEPTPIRELLASYSGDQAVWRTAHQGANRCPFPCQARFCREVHPARASSVTNFVEIMTGPDAILGRKSQQPLPSAPSSPLVALGHPCLPCV